MTRSILTASVAAAFGALCGATVVAVLMPAMIPTGALLGVAISAGYIYWHREQLAAPPQVFVFDSALARGYEGSVVTSPDEAPGMLLSDLLGYDLVDAEEQLDSIERRLREVRSAMRSPSLRHRTQRDG